MGRRCCWLVAVALDALLLRRTDVVDDKKIEEEETQEEEHNRDVDDLQGSAERSM